MNDLPHPAARAPARGPEQDTEPGLTPLERRAAWSLSAIYVVRMLGLFIVLPVFALHAHEYAGATPFGIGLALGIYGLLQALLQVPLGRLSDRVGRKPVIGAGLALLALGSVVAALADTMAGVILGRALQGAGAMAAALMALAADLVRDERRTRVMATLGASIGLAFVLALVLGPAIVALASIDALFWLTAACALACLVLLHVAVPDPPRRRHHADVGADPGTMRRLAAHPDLARLNVSVFVLHLLIVATFVVVPGALADAGIGAGRQWQVWLGAMVVSIGLMALAVTLAERRAMRAVLLGCAATMLVCQGLFGGVAEDAIGGAIGSGALVLLVAVTLFFGALNTLEALLPSLVSRIAPAGARGSAMGLYSASQFLGAFVGGVGAGWLLEGFGAGALFAALALACVAWALVLAGLGVPARARTVRRALTDEELGRVDAVLAELAARPDVVEVAHVPAEGAVYLKTVDRAESSVLA